ncbi:hypothetical protein M422DRAFT_786411, partial [Sphaerobolus stellatus SS14]
MSQDELAEINGIKPKKLLAEGESMEAKSWSSSTVYDIKRTLDHYYCNCPAWRNQGGAPVNARSCKHLRAALGDAYEDARLQLKNPHGQTTKGKKKAPASKGKKPASSAGKRKRDDEDGDDEDEDEDASPKKRTRSSRRGKKKADDDEEEDDDDDEDSPKRKTRSSGRGKKKADDDDEEDDDDNNNVGSSSIVPFSVLLAQSYKVDGKVDITGWWMSEKLDGVRTYYDGKRMISRLGNPFTPPKELLAKLPKDVTLDGELFAGRGKFQETVSIVKTINSPHWKEIIFQVFDIPSKGNLPFEERMEILQALFGPSGTHTCAEVQIVKQIKIKQKEHMFKMLKSVESKGGEGVMLREPGSFYEGRRSNTLLKVK